MPSKRKPLPSFAYHWAPVACRESIARTGLIVSPGGITASRPTVCMSPSPIDAWTLSGDLRDKDSYDLWQVKVPEGAFWRADGFPEIRSFVDIPPADLIWVASR